MTLDPKLLEILACPQDKGPLLYFADEQSLYNPRLHRRYRVLEGDIPYLLIWRLERRDRRRIDQHVLARAGRLDHRPRRHGPSG